MLPRNQIMSAQQANAIMLQQQQQQRRIHRGALPTVIPHNSANLESQLLCNYSQYLCKREKVSNHDFCSRHILEDKNSAYKQCNYEYKVTKRRCSRPAPKNERKDGFCTEHARKKMLEHHNKNRKRPFSDPVHKYLEDLSYYKQAKPEPKPEIPSVNLGAASTSKPETEGFEDLEKEITPFEIGSQPSRIPTPPPHKTFDFGSEEDDNESITVENTWRGDDDSDDDSVDSEMENPLKYAGAYSAEEVIRIMRDKLIRLQKLYIDQFQRLQYLLKEERRQYRMALRKEHEAELMSIHKQPKETLEDKAAYDELKALNHYNKPAGIESLLHSKLMERRIRLSETSASLMPNTVPGSLAGRLTIPTPVVQKCSFNITSSTKCGDICIPMTKFCQKHILNDPNQVLFRKCGVVVASEEDDQSQTTDDGPCETAIPDVLDSHSCVYHTPFQHPFPTSALEMEAIKKADKQALMKETNAAVVAMTSQPLLQQQHQQM